MLKNRIKTIDKKGLYYIVEDEDKLLKFKPWLGDAFSFLYDFIMKNSIFPKKFGGDINQHYEILSEEMIIRTKHHNMTLLLTPRAERLLVLGELVVRRNSPVAPKKKLYYNFSEGCYI